MRAAHGKDFFIEQPLSIALNESPLTKQHRHITVAVQGVMAAFASDQADINLRVGRMKPRQTRHQPIGRKGEIGGDLQHLTGRLLDQRLQAGIDLLQARLNVQEQAQASFRQGNAAINTIKQANAQVRFQPLELLADRRLCRAQLESRGRETAMARRRFKGAQQVEGHVTQGFIH